MFTGNAEVDGDSAHVKEKVSAKYIGDIKEVTLAEEAKKAKEMDLQKLQQMFQ
ncbi:hypothetical protein J2Z48_001017 [Croceifilum oryzae]|uniref:Uncharacterized protein n=1 Tax=Croceifilum oryzae TaxID=1553429 RepID=A0AAJ1WRQ7_9BACL|nr:hypothetical protein [Croceifilum oryzae]MDQ0416845.1 hypothetical protein [Croceifilum oryzae]